MSNAHTSNLEEMDSSDTDEEINNTFIWKSSKRPSKEDLSDSDSNQLAAVDQQPASHEKKTDSSISKSRSGKEPIEYDEEGNPKLPVKLGVITLHNLGVVNFSNPLYHSSRHIFPVGFKTSRPYISTISPDKNTIYTSTIAEAKTWKECFH